MPFRVCVPRGLPARGGVRFDDFALFPARRSLGRGGRFRPSRRLDALSRCYAGSLFSLLQCPQPAKFSRRNVLPLLPDDPIRFPSHSFCLVRRELRLVPGLQFRFPGLLRGPPAKLRPVLPSRRRKVTILGTVQVRPGVQNRHIFGRFHYREIFVPVCVAHIHALVLEYWWSTGNLKFCTRFWQ